MKTQMMTTETPTKSPDEVIVVVEPEPKKKETPPLKRYFHEGTQAAIVAYQKETDYRVKNALYEAEIAPAFEKLAENLINIHKFSAAFDTFDDLKSNCVNFLFETIIKFDHSRGTNAFSYFNVVAKNWLIIETKKKIIRSKRNTSLDDPQNLTAQELKHIENQQTVQSQETELSNQYSVKNMINLLFEIRDRSKNENELQVVNAIITIFENINDIDITQKGAIMLYIRELSGLTPKQLTTALQQVKKQFKKLKIDPRFMY
jgi:hypothetical protein